MGDSKTHSSNVKRINLVINTLTKAQYEANKADIIKNHADELFFTTDEVGSEGSGGGSGRDEIWYFQLADGTVIPKRMCIHDQGTVKITYKKNPPV